MIYMPQAAPPPPAAVAPVNGPATPIVTRLVPDRARRCAADTTDIVICAPDQQAFRLRPLPPPPGGPGFLQRPHVLKLAPNVAIGFIGGGKGPSVRVEF